jgi:acyl-CoA synthetase (AMP-forming)/AMP-acid ligase II
MITRIEQHPRGLPALYDEEERRFLSYGEVSDMVRASAEVLRTMGGPALALQLCPTSVDAIVSYLAVRAARFPLVLADPDSPASTSLVENYRPTCLLLAAGTTAPAGYEPFALIGRGGVAIWRSATRACPVSPHPELAVLLPTSGSTGNPKLVRLSERNVQANASAIAEYLQLGPGERAVQNLPMHYSYGLSIVNSHLYAGGAVVPTKHSFIQREFWGLFDAVGCTSFAGVPYVYETLRRLRLDPGTHPTLRTMTQAGGALRPDIVASFHSAAAARGQHLFVMYGQTEATARIAYVPPQRLAEKLGTVGIAIPGGRLRLESVPESDVNELVYEGPNVMFGYANSVQDLALGDVQHGILRTGDLGEMDGDGFFRITGRLARFAKLFGRRVQLADVEAHIERAFDHSAAVLEAQNALDVYVEDACGSVLDAVRASVCALLAVPPSAIRVQTVAMLPKTSSGKKDYRALAA